MGTGIAIAAFSHLADWQGASRRSRQWPRSLLSPPAPRPGPHGGGPLISWNRVKTFRRHGPLRNDPLPLLCATIAVSRSRMCFSRRSPVGDPPTSRSPKTRRAGSRRTSQSCRLFSRGRPASDTPEAFTCPTELKPTRYSWASKANAGNRSIAARSRLRTTSILLIHLTGRFAANWPDSAYSTDRSSARVRG